MKPQPSKPRGTAPSDDERKRRRPRQRRAEDTVAVILEAAARVFAQEGYDATTNRIAEKAGVGVGSIYEYFSNKDALLLELARAHLSNAERRVADALELPDHASATDVLESVARAIDDVHRRHPEMHETLQRVSNLAPSLAERATALQAAIIDRLSESMPPTVSSETRAVRARVVVSALGALTHELVLQEPDSEVQRRLRQELFQMCLAQLDRVS